MSRETDEQLVDNSLKVLGEHFDTVQIFVNRHESFAKDGTIHLAKGVGNWFARRGQIADWLIVENEVTRKSVKVDA